MIPGGHTDIMVAESAIQDKVTTELQQQVEARLQKTFAIFNVTHYRRQTVAGIIWHFKINVGDDTSIHLRVFEPLPYTNKPMEIQALELKTSGDLLEIMAPS